MFLFGTVSAGVFAAVAFGSWWLLRARPQPLATAVGAVSIALWVAGMTVAWFVEKDESHGRSELVQSLDSLAWPVAAESAPVRAAPAPTAAGVQAGSVESLVAGLEARLAAQPNDAKGWALLAQSYGYTANEEAGEHAIRRAVELGVEELSLRERVAVAKRSVHAGDWVDRSLGTAR